MRKSPRKSSSTSTSNSSHTRATPICRKCPGSLHPVKGCPRRIRKTKDAINSGQPNLSTLAEGHHVATQKETGSKPSDTPLFPMLPVVPQVHPAAPPSTPAIAEKHDQSFRFHPYARYYGGTPGYPEAPLDAHQFYMYYPDARLPHPMAPSTYFPYAPPQHLPAPPPVQAWSPDYSSHQSATSASAHLSFAPQETRSPATSALPPLSILEPSALPSPTDPTASAWPPLSIPDPSALPSTTNPYPQESAEPNEVGPATITQPEFSSPHSSSPLLAPFQMEDSDNSSSSPNGSDVDQSEYQADPEINTPSSSIASTSRSRLPSIVVAKGPRGQKAPSRFGLVAGAGRGRNPLPIDRKRALKPIPEDESIAATRFNKQIRPLLQKLEHFANDTGSWVYFGAQHQRANLPFHWYMSSRIRSDAPEDLTDLHNFAYETFQRLRAASRALCREQLRREVAEQAEKRAEQMTRQKEKEWTDEVAAKDRELAEKQAIIDRLCSLD